MRVSPIRNLRETDCLFYTIAWFLPEEFAQVNSELLEAEEDDEIDQIAAQSKPRKSTSRRRSTQQGPETSEERSEVVSRVETYVNEKSQWVAKHQKVSFFEISLHCKLRLINDLFLAQSRPVTSSKSLLEGVRKLSARSERENGLCGKSELS